MHATTHAELHPHALNWLRGCYLLLVPGRSLFVAGLLNFTALVGD
jgi:hypothetical protein